MHSRIRHYAIRSTTRIAPLYHPESNPFRLAPLTFPPSQKGFCRITLNYRITDPQSSSTYPSTLLYSTLFNSIQFNSIHFTPSNPFQLIRLIQFHSTRPEILFRSTEYESHNHTKQKKRKSIFNKYSFSEDHYTISMAALYASQPLLFKNQTDIV